MDSRKIFEKIQNRNKYVRECGDIMKHVYSEYLKSSLSYDNLKKGFYIALQLSKHDAQFPEEKLERYEHLVKHFDQQLLKQLKERDYEVQKTDTDTDKDKEIARDDFQNRFVKIETAGISRNRIYYEFIDYKREFDNSKFLFHNEISLALKDGLITDIDHKIHNESIKFIEKAYEEGMIKVQKDYNQKRVCDHAHRYNPGQNVSGRNYRGRGRNYRGRGRNYRGRGRSNRGRGPYYSGLGPY